MTDAPSSPGSNSTERSVRRRPTELAWLVAHGEIRTLAPGERLLADQPVVDSLWVVLSGRFSIRIDRGAGPRKVMEWVGGDVSGYLPYSRMTSSPGDVTVEEATEVLTVHRSCYRELITGCPELTAMLVHVMVDRDPPVHFQRLPCREDELARPLGCGACARAEQSRLGRRSRRQGAASSIGRSRGQRAGAGCGRVVTGGSRDGRSGPEDLRVRDRPRRPLSARARRPRRRDRRLAARPSRRASGRRGTRPFERDDGGPRSSSRRRSTSGRCRSRCARLPRAASPIRPRRKSRRRRRGSTLWSWR